CLAVLFLPTFLFLRQTCTAILIGTILSRPVRRTVAQSVATTLGAALSGLRQQRLDQCVGCRYGRWQIERPRHIGHVSPRHAGDRLITTDRTNRSASPAV